MSQKLEIIFYGMACFDPVSTDPTAKLKFEKPAKNPKPPVNVKDPTIKYSLLTPDIMCSPVVTELSGWS